MFIKLTGPIKHHGNDKKAGEVIGVHPSLGERLIAEGHQKTTEQAESPLSVLSDEEVDAFTYKEAKALVTSLKIETSDAKFNTLKMALKIHFETLRS